MSETTTITPQQAAESLGLTVWDLRTTLRTWVQEELERCARGAGLGATLPWSASELEEELGKAKRLIRAAEACEAAQAEEYEE